MVGLGRFELPTYGLGNQRSIHLSYSPHFSSFYNEKQVSESSIQIIPFHRLDHLIETREVAGSPRHISYNHFSKELHVTATVLLGCPAARSEVVGALPDRMRRNRAAGDLRADAAGPS